MSKSRRPARPTVLPHPYVRQDGMPADPWTQLAPCRDCNKLGKAGDAQHPATVEESATAFLDEARSVEARMLGERNQDDA